MTVRSEVMCRIPNSLTLVQLHFVSFSGGVLKARLFSLPLCLFPRLFSVLRCCVNVNRVLIILKSLQSHLIGHMASPLETHVCAHDGG